MQCVRKETIKMPMAQTMNYSTPIALIGDEQLLAIRLASLVQKGIVLNIEICDYAIEEILGFSQKQLALYGLGKTVNGVLYCFGHKNIGVLSSKGVIKRNVVMQLNSIVPCKTEGLVSYKFRDNHCTDMLISPLGEIRRGVLSFVAENLMKVNPPLCDFDVKLEDRTVMPSATYMMLTDIKEGVSLNKPTLYNSIEEVMQLGVKTKIKSEDIDKQAILAPSNSVYNTKRADCVSKNVTLRDDTYYVKIDVTNNSELMHMRDWLSQQSEDFNLVVDVSGAGNSQLSLQFKGKNIQIYAHDLVQTRDICFQIKVGTNVEVKIKNCALLQGLYIPLSRTASVQSMFIQTTATPRLLTLETVKTKVAKYYIDSEYFKQISFTDPRNYTSDYVELFTNSEHFKGCECVSNPKYRIVELTTNSPTIITHSRGCYLSVGKLNLTHNLYSCVCKIDLSATDIKTVAMVLIKGNTWYDNVIKQIIDIQRFSLHLPSDLKHFDLELGLMSLICFEAVKFYYALTLPENKWQNDTTAFLQNCSIEGSVKETTLYYMTDKQANKLKFGLLQQAQQVDYQQSFNEEHLRVLTQFISNIRLAARRTGE